MNTNGTNSSYPSLCSLQSHCSGNCNQQSAQNNCGSTKGNGCLYGECTKCHLSNSSVIVDGYIDAAEDLLNAETEGKSIVAVRLNVANMLHYNNANEEIWEAVTHLFFGCLTVKSIGSEVCLDEHKDKILKSASTYIPQINRLLRRYPHIKLVLTFAYPGIVGKQITEALTNDQSNFFKSMTEIVDFLGADAVELDISMMNAFPPNSTQLVLAICQSTIRGKVFLNIGTNFDMNNSYNIGNIKAFSLLCGYIIVNSFGLFDYGYTSTATRGALKFLKPTSECSVMQSKRFLESVLKHVAASKVIFAIDTAGVVFETEDNAMVKSVYEIAWKDIDYNNKLSKAMGVDLNLQSEHFYTSYDTVDDRKSKILLINSKKLKGVLCGDLYFDVDPMSPNSLLSIALNNME